MTYDFIVGSDWIRGRIVLDRLRVVGTSWWSLLHRGRIQHAIVANC